MRLGCEAVDQVLPDPTIHVRPDMVDVLHNHRVSEGKQTDLPAELLRRYELRFEPRRVKKGI
jgi:hypothetical protein